MRRSRDLLGGVAHDHRRHRDGALRPGPRQRHPRRRAGAARRLGRRHLPAERRDRPAPRPASADAYGPLAVHVTGTASAPRIALDAASPGFGIGLRDVRADVRATRAGLGDPGDRRIGLRAVLGRRRHPLQSRPADHRGQPADLRRRSISRGRLVQTRAGPFAGTLTLAGPGPRRHASGSSAAGRYQRLDIAATANGARTPGDEPIIIQRGLVKATIILDAANRRSPATPSSPGSAAATCSSQRARAPGRSRRAAAARAQLFAEGRRGVPFRVAANAAVAPEPDPRRDAGPDQQYRLPLRPAGRDRAATARIWRLAPATVALERGRIRLAGRWGDGLVIQSRLDSFDLSMLNAFSPGLGLGGQATGSLDFAQPAGRQLPARRGAAQHRRLHPHRHRRALDAGRHRSRRQSAARRRRAGRDHPPRRRVIGRVQARLQPLGPGAGSWTTRLLAAPLAGGIRYNGPADVPMSFANLPGHQLDRPDRHRRRFQRPGAEPAIHRRRPRQQPHLRQRDLRHADHQPRRRRPLHAARSSRSSRCPAAPGNGTIQGQGTIGLASAAGFPIDLRLEFQNARLARSDDIGAVATGNLAIVNNRERRLDHRRARSRRGPLPDRPPGRGRSAAARRRAPPRRAAADAGRASAADAGVPSIWRLDIRLNADNRVFVSGMGLESEWQARPARRRARPRRRELVGQVELIRGTLGLAGRRFRLDRGRVDLRRRAARPTRRSTSPRPATSRMSRSASTSSGRANNPQIAFTSSPGLPQDEVVSRILFGSSVTADFGAAGGPARRLAEFAARQRRRPQPARPAALGDRHRPAAHHRRRHRHRPRHRGRRRHVPLRRHLCGDHHRREGLHRHPARNLAVARP